RESCAWRHRRIGTARASWPAPQRQEISEQLRRLAPDAVVDARTAHGPEVAPLACAFGRRGRQAAELDRAIDDLQHLAARGTGAIVERNDVLGESARRGAVEQPPAL